jgi:hypothetical protein
MNDELNDYLNDKMSESDRRYFEEKNKMYVGGKEDLKQQKELWDLIKTLPEPEPSESLSENFYQMLGEFEDENRSSFWAKVKGYFAGLQIFQPRFKLAYSVGLLIIGIASSLFINSYFFSNKSTEEIAILSAEVKEMKEMVMLSLLEDPSASERIRAVSLTEELPSINQRVIKALLVTLNNDDNDNVRIMTLEALATMADNPKVREGLVASITQQESPLVQAAIADVMVVLQEKKAVNSLKKLLRKKNLNEGVKMKIEQSLLEII